MGGYNSGRWGGRPTVDQSHSIDLPMMFRRGWVKDHHGSGGTLRWKRGDEECGSIGYTYTLLDDYDPKLTLDFTRRPHGGEPQQVKQVIRLISTKPQYGGRRWWMVCPVNGARVATLHLPPGGDRFASRKAWRLGYQSQRIASRDRPFEALFRLQKKLGSPQGWETPLFRPKGMWHSTYQRHLDRYYDLDDQCGATMGPVIARLMDQTDRHKF